MLTKFSHQHPQQDQPNATGGVQYRRAAEAISIHEQQSAPTMSKGITGTTVRRPNTKTTTKHRVVAHPMEPLYTVETSYPDSPPQQPQPALYDTSVSSATLTNSAEDGRSTGSSGVHHHHYRLSQRSQTPTQHPLYETTELIHRYNPRTDTRYSHHEMDINDPTYVTHSEPGASVEHDRFAAYINRFAELDPRMDHRYSIEDKKMDDLYPIQQQLSTIKQRVDRVQQKNRFRTRSGYSPDQSHSTTIPTSQSKEHPTSSTRPGGRKANRTEEALSDVVTNSPSSRTRDLARRIEQHMERKQLLLQQQRDLISEYDPYDVSTSHVPSAVNTRVSFEEPMQKQATASRNTNPSTKPITQPHFYYPQHQLAATYVPIPKPQQNMEPGTYQKHAPVETKTISTPRYEKQVSPQKVSPKQQDDVVSDRIDVSNAPSYPYRSKERSMEDVSTMAKTESNTSIRSKQAMQQKQSLLYLQSKDRERTAVMNEQAAPQNQQRVSRRSEQSQQQPRSRSLGPPQRRRQQAVHESGPTQQYTASPYDSRYVTDEIEAKNNQNNPIPTEPLIRRLGNRAEIETPLPANVRELRRMLWTEDELLQVKTRSSYRDHGGDNNYGKKSHHMYGPEMAGTAGQRNTRSLSPKTHRIRNDIENKTTNRQYGTSAREQKGKQFKSRYYEAALRGEMSASPKRGTAMTTADPDENVPKTKSFDSVTPIEQRKSSSSSEYRSRSTEEIETTLAIQPDMTNSSSTRQVTNMRNMEHTKQTEATGSSMKQEYAMYLLRKINQVNKDDPHAALAEINALLRQQPAVAELPAKSIPKNSIQCIDDPVTREASSVPGVEQARPMECDNESDDESDGTSVSSMTNPTFVDQRHKDSVPISPSSGRPRPSLLGSYNNPAPKVSSTNRVATEARPLKVEKEEPKVGSVLEQQNYGGLLGSRDVTFQQAADNEAAKNKATDVVLDQSKPEMLDMKSTPSLLSQLGSLVSPRRLDDQESKQITVKIKQWDDLSTGEIPINAVGASKTIASKEEMTDTEIKSEAKLSERRNVSPGSALKRDHPWDAAIPVRMGQINTMDTSMDCGDGIEAEFTPKYSKAQSSSRSSGNVLPVRHQNDTSVQPVMSPRHADHRKETHKFLSNQHKQAKAMSDDFDTAWVSLPSSTFFGSNEGDGHSKRNNTTATNQRSHMPTGDHGEVQSKETLFTDITDDVEVEYVHNTTRIRSGEIQTIAPEESNFSYAQLKSQKRDVYPRHRKSSTFDENYEENSNQSAVATNKSFETVPIAGDEAVSRGRGLRGYLKRKQEEKALAGSNIDRASASVVSRRSAATTTTAVRPLGEMADIEASPSNGNYSELVNRYTRRSAKSRSPSRTRSRSVDERRTMRTPSLARKLNRLLRVYDHDNTELIEV